MVNRFRRDESANKNEMSSARKTSKIIQDMDFSSINEDLRLRLDLCQDENTELEKQVKILNVKVTKAEELR